MKYGCNTTWTNQSRFFLKVEYGYIWCFVKYYVCIYVGRIVHKTIPYPKCISWHIPLYPPNLPYPNLKKIINDQDALIHIISVSISVTYWIQICGPLGSIHASWVAAQCLGRNFENTVWHYVSEFSLKVKLNKKEKKRKTKVFGSFSSSSQILWSISRCRIIYLFVIFKQVVLLFEFIIHTSLFRITKETQRTQENANRLVAFFCFLFSYMVGNIRFMCKST